MLISPLTAAVYLPLLPLLSTHFRTGAEAIDLTITVYIIFQALAPLVLANVSDHSGRRPIYLATLTLYTVASLSLALNKSSYAALLALLSLQSLGASAVLSVTYGTVADICVPAKRGKMLGPVLAPGNVGTWVGPIVGDWIALESGGFHAAFWALVGSGGLKLAALALLMPETARNVVGKVTSRTVNGINRSGVYFNSAGMVARLGKASEPAMTMTLVTTTAIEPPPTPVIPRTLQPKQTLPEA
jgi:MFS family permease